MKRMTLISVWVILTALVLARCDKTRETTGTTSIEFFSTKPENMATLQKLVDAFTAENSGIKVTLSSPAQAGSVLRSRLTKNDMPDVLAIGGDNLYTELSGSGILLDIGGEAFNSRIQGSYQNMLFDLHGDKSKTVYGIPYAANASGVLYNKEIFAQYGVSIPQTWDEFLQAAAAFKNNGVNPFLLTFADQWTLLPIWNSLVPSLIPASFASAKAAGAASFAGTHEEVLRKYLAITALTENDYMGTSYDDGNKAFAQGQAAMMINGVWAIPEFKKTNAAFGVDTFPFPATNEVSKNYIVSGIDVLLAVSASTKNTAAAIAFIDFLTRQEIAQRYVNEQFAFSAVKGVVQEAPEAAGIAEVIAAGRVADFPDHSYPAGYDLAAILSQFALNYKNGKDADQNIKETLDACDREFDALK
jgi:raffinose/stachyose/melibiose transport system substrate-binding protein